MLAMPLPCKILKNQSSSASVDIVTFGQISKDIHSLNPYSLGEVIDFEWDNLSYAEVQSIEAIFRSAKATERFSYEFSRYLMEDGFTITIQGNKPRIQASFRKVQ
jgi:hypothetical protein